MAATIEVNGIRAHISDRHWCSDNREVAADLQPLTDPNQVPAWIPDEDNYLAEFVARRVGGQVVTLNPPDESDDHEPDGSAPVY